jgi:hypothetical protein
MEADGRLHYQSEILETSQSLGELHKPEERALDFCAE